MRLIYKLAAVLLFAAPLAAQQINPNNQINWTGAGTGQIIYAQANDTISSIEAECSSVCTYIVTVPQAFTLTSNHILSGNVQLKFESGGKWIINGGFTLTVPGNVTGTLNTHFVTPAGHPLAFGGAAAQVPVEWFGAIGDWNGSTGTDNTTQIQACLNAVISGQCVLQSLSYKITSVLSITKSSVGIAGTSTGTILTNFVPSQISSALVSTSSTADMIDVTGTSTSVSLGFNKFNDFALRRSVATTGTARGFQFTYVYAATVDRVSIEDSGTGIYFHGFGSSGIGSIENVSVTWGFGSVVATSGSYAGFYLDSANGESNPSIRIRNVAVSSALGSGVTTYGLNSTGEALNDLHLRNFETAGVDYGIYLIESAGALSSTDVHIWDAVNDNCQITCIYVANSIGPAAVEISGGWAFKGGTASSPAIDLESAKNVTVSNYQIYFPTASTGVLVNGGSNNTVTGVTFTGSPTSAAVTGINTSFLNVTNNQLVNIANACAICFTNVANGNLALNNISGTGTYAITLDAATHGISGLPSNTVNGTYSSGPLQDLGINPTSPIYFQLNPGSAAKPTCSAGAKTEGMFWYAVGSGSAHGSLQICQNQSGSYTWVTITS